MSMMPSGLKSALVIFWIKVLYTSVGEAHENQIKDVDDAYVLEPSD